MASVDEQILELQRISVALLRAQIADDEAAVAQLLLNLPPGVTPSHLVVFLIGWLRSALPALGITAESLAQATLDLATREAPLR